MVEFTGVAGDVEPLSIDTSALTIENMNTNVQENTDQGATTLTTATSNAKTLVSTANSGVTWKYHAGDDSANEETCAAGVCTIDASTKTIDLNVGGGTTHDGTIYRQDERLKLACGSKDIGSYTVSTTVSTADAVVLAEAPPNCDGATGNQITIRPMTSYLEVNADLTAILPTGSFIKTNGLSGDAGPVEYVNWHIDAGNDFKDVGRVLFSAHTVVSIADGVPTYETNQPNSNPGAVNGDDLDITGNPTSENTQCSDRGVCDTEAGDCKCFGGYTGLACENQNALSA